MYVEENSIIRLLSIGTHGLPPQLGPRNIQEAHPCVLLACGPFSRKVSSHQLFFLPLPLYSLSLKCSLFRLQRESHPPCPLYSDSPTSYPAPSFPEVPREDKSHVLMANQSGSSQGPLSLSGPTSKSLSHPEPSFHQTVQ